MMPQRTNAATRSRSCVQLSAFGPPKASTNWCIPERATGYTQAGTAESAPSGRARRRDAAALREVAKPRVHVVERLQRDEPMPGVEHNLQPHVLTCRAEPGDVLERGRGPYQRVFVTLRDEDRHVDGRGARRVLAEPRCPRLDH